ncbi:MAG: WYL domain-containing protein [Clostridiaceae bacterium]|nr:WYL domain-containing protein [Clostridiaceae bacterium]
MADVRQIERQIHILSILSESKMGYTIPEIHNNLKKLGIDVSRKTIERDIDDISRHFFVYEEKNEEGEVCYKADKYNIKNITFTLPELISIYFLKEILNPYAVLDVGKTAREMLDNLLQNVPAVNQNYINFISDLMKVNPSEAVPEKYINEDYIRIIREAIEKNLRLKIEYFSFDSNEMTRRKIDPYYLEIREGCYHLICYCHLRKEIRDFRVSRIKKLEILNETFKRPENFYEEYNRNRFEKMIGDEHITLKIIFEGQAARYIKEYEAHRADRITDLDDDKIIFEKKTTYSPDILQWVLRFGGDAEVLEPDALKFEITWEIERMHKKYSNK